ncbi:hypothetical protein BDZ90DRAFT_83312 [Jaminaea rosea]|uniref:Uncharacterized protein n=1 Tax=Jaminaea rosea TaxID=1569628 RepID=A0A316UIV3_9BASI|nr:hypothetical protein BDZ90DRAFT_83312 [Jaminaea rosea]PWN25206.1 hypothetical protein BDZ90DRAFT_83312 [Jaminaea rosea]
MAGLDDRCFLARYNLVVEVEGKKAVMEWTRSQFLPPIPSRLFGILRAELGQANLDHVQPPSFATWNWTALKSEQSMGWPNSFLQASTMLMEMCRRAVAISEGELPRVYLLRAKGEEKTWTLPVSLLPEGNLRGTDVIIPVDSVAPAVWIAFKQSDDLSTVADSEWVLHSGTDSKLLVDVVKMARALVAIGDWQPPLSKVRRKSKEDRANGVMDGTLPTDDKTIRIFGIEVYRPGPLAGKDTVFVKLDIPARKLIWTTEAGDRATQVVDEDDPSDRCGQVKLALEAYLASKAKTAGDGEESGVYSGSTGGSGSGASASGS